MKKSSWIGILNVFHMKMMARTRTTTVRRSYIRKKPSKTHRRKQKEIQIVKGQRSKIRFHKFHVRFLSWPPLAKNLSLLTWLNAVRAQAPTAGSCLGKPTYLPLCPTIFYFCFFDSQISLLNFFINIQISVSAENDTQLV